MTPALASHGGWARSAFRGAAIIRRNVMIWFALLALLFVLFLLLLPPWPYMRGTGLGYGPSGIALALLMVLLILWWFSAIAVWWPWWRPV